MGAPKKVETARDHQLIANHHSAALHFPKYDEKGMAIGHITIEPHEVVPVPIDLWRAFKKTPQIAYLIEQGSLAEVTKAGPVPIHTDSSSEPIVPEHLLAPGEEVQQAVGDITAKVKHPKPNAGTVNVDVVAK